MQSWYNKLGERSREIESLTKSMNEMILSAGRLDPYDEELEDDDDNISYQSTNSSNYDDEPVVGAHSNEDRGGNKYGPSKNIKLNPWDGVKRQPYHGQTGTKISKEWQRVWKAPIANIGNDPNRENHLRLMQMISAAEIRSQAHLPDPYRERKPLYSGTWYFELYQHFVPNIKAWPRGGPSKYTARLMNASVRAAYRSAATSQRLVREVERGVSSGPYTDSRLQEARIDKAFQSRGVEPAGVVPCIRKADDHPRGALPSDPFHGFNHSGGVNYKGMVQESLRYYTIWYNSSRVPGTPDHAALFTSELRLRRIGTQDTRFLDDEIQGTGVGPTKAKAERAAAAAFVHSGKISPTLAKKAKELEDAERRREESKTTGPRIQVVVPSKPAFAHSTRSALNGLNGEWTNSDDRPCLNKSGHQRVDVSISARYRSKNHRTPSPIVRDEVKIKPVNPAPKPNQLNGAHGEYTGSDDVRGGKSMTKGDFKQMIDQAIRREARVLARPKPQPPKPKKKPQKARPPQPGPRQGGGHVPHPVEVAAVSAFAVPPGTMHLPITPSHDTIKATAKAHAYVTANAAGEGFFWVCPTLANDRNSLLVTDGAYTGVAGAPPVRTTTATIGVLGVAANLPMNHLKFNEVINGQRSTEGRISSVGFKVSAHGRADERPGNVHVYTKPSNADVSVTSWPEMTTNQRTHVTTYTNSQTVEHSLLPAELSQKELSQSVAPWATPAGSYYDYVLAAATGGAAVAIGRITGATPGFQYFIEYIVHVEYAGGDLSAMTTPNDVLPEAMDSAHAIHSALNRLHIQHPGNERHDIARLHSSEKMAATGLTIAAGAGVPGAGLTASGVKLLESKRGTALTSALFGMKRK